MGITYGCCPQCGEYDYIGTGLLSHRCKPSWECRGDWMDDDWWKTIHARDAEEAAEKFAEYYDCEGGEYAIVSNRMRDPVVILVRKPGYGPPQPGEQECERFTVDGETVPHYRATRLAA